MKIIILRHSATDFFIEAKKIEESTPEGEWRYFKFSSMDSVLGIYENESQGIDIHPDFFKCFLGQFSPSVESNFDIIQCSDFNEFCETLNKLLMNNEPVLDLSVNGLWLWTVNEKKLALPKKLKTYLSY